MNEEGIGTKIYRMDEMSNMLCDRHVSKYAQLDGVQLSAYKLRDRDVLFKSHKLSGICRTHGDIQTVLE